MAHLAKYNASALGNMTAHYNRTPQLERGYERSNIDVDRTHLNYNLAPLRDIGDVEFINRRIDELHLKRKPRSDAIRMCDWVVTLPTDVDAQDKARFFDAAYGYMVGLYGEENVVSSWVHMDEATPHMHFAFVPVTQDGRLSAKDVISRAHLNSWHEGLSDYVERELGYQVSVLLDEKSQGDKQLSHLSQDEYIAAKARLECLRHEVQQAQFFEQRERELETGIDELREQISRCQAELKLTDDRATMLERGIRELHERVELLVGTMCWASELLERFRDWYSRRIQRCVEHVAPAPQPTLGSHQTPSKAPQNTGLRARGAQAKSASQAKSEANRGRSGWSMER